MFPKATTSFSWTFTRNCRNFVCDAALAFEPPAASQASQVRQLFRPLTSRLTSINATFCNQLSESYRIHCSFQNGPHNHGYLEGGRTECGRVHYARGVLAGQWLETYSDAPDGRIEEDFQRAGCCRVLLRKLRVRLWRLQFLFLLALDLHRPLRTTAPVRPDTTAQFVCNGTYIRCSMGLLGPKGF